MYHTQMSLLLIATLATAGCGSSVSSSRLDGVRAEAPTLETSTQPSNIDPQKGSLRFENQNVNLGEVSGMLDHAFHFQNGGQHVVKITRVRPSCNCSSAATSMTEVPPGKAGKIAIHVDLNKQRRGSHQFTILVEYRDPDPRSEVLALNVFNSPDLAIVPETVEITSYNRRSVGTKVIVTDYRKKPLELVKLVASASWLHANVVEEPRSYSNGWNYEIEVFVDGESISGEVKTAKILLHTSDQRIPILEIPVRVNVVDRLVTAPTVVRSWHRGRDGDFFASVTVRDREGENVVIRSVESSSGNISADWEDSRTITPFRVVRLRWAAASASAAEGNYRIRIGLTKPCEQTVSVALLAPQL